MIRETKEEALREQMKPGTGDRVSFDHGGKHNDLLHAWEMSLYGVMEYQKTHFGNQGNEIVYGGAVDDYETLTDEEVMIQYFKERFTGYSDDVDVKIL